jgi:hypothetical protein
LQGSDLLSHNRNNGNCDLLVIYLVTLLSFASLPELNKASSKSLLTRKLKLYNMPEYIYPRLSQPDSIRLLQLLPREEDPKNLRCNLFEYPLRNCDNSSHPYEALSYVWGSETKPRFILIDGQNLGVTENLYTLLLRLQAHNCSRIIWVDAVCINQTNEEEKETQISLMAEIYAKAIRVIVWLGKTEDNSDQALERIRFVGEKLTNSSNAELSHQAIPQLLKRQWFQRIWVRNHILMVLEVATK